MDLPMSPEPPTVQIVALLIGTLFSALLLAAVGYLIWKAVRTGRLTLRGQETISAHTIRSGYTQGLRDAGWHQHQDREFQQAQARLDQFITTLNHTGTRLDDVLRRLNQATAHPAPGAADTGPITVATGGVPFRSAQHLGLRQPGRPQPHRAGRP